ncbi:hypothetical protein PHMEG_00018865 [Phytophthora megakarya]|uniref:Peptidase A2 domain-containing protein n=1 Tax=Phytophthora megakarya TaxID=4795 RepID=A0A225VUI3_9STRA|nr:hypothetical protein PHMEG_00018865 [Phytophthora megakarya]
MPLIQDDIIYPERLYPEYQRSNEANSHEIATVCEAINDLRTRILLDTGALLSIVSLDLARRVRIKIRTHRQIMVSGLGGVPTYISAHACVKITLGWKVVYLQNVWIENIGEGEDVLLDMNFMYSAGITSCIREGIVKLPDEEDVVMYDDVPRKRRCRSARRKVGTYVPVKPQQLRSNMVRRIRSAK